MIRTVNNLKKRPLVLLLLFFAFYTVIFVSCKAKLNDADIPFNAQYIRTNGYHESVKYPILTVIKSSDELLGYFDTYKDKYDFRSRKYPASDSTIGFKDAIEKYDEDFFDNSFLAAVILEEGSGSVRHKISSVTESGIISIDRLVPEVVTDDMAEWNILIEIEVKYKDAAFQVVCN
ncbi:MAG TPA: hypothetical protein VFD25_05685 [Clostridia bacterium]|nr:hypothetical protein [Clostridia bacterium]